MAKKESLKCLWSKKAVLLKYGDRIHVQEELHWGHEERLIIYFEVRRGIGIA